MQSKGRGLSSERGFTLIELLTTMTIVGILSAIVTGQFHAYTSRALAARAESDIRGAITAEEAFYAENESYAACSGAACNTVLPGYFLSVDVQLDIVTRGADQFFDAVCFHPRGDKRFSYSSETGAYDSVPM